VEESRRSQDFGDRCARGITISRRPNRRASSENAPGPRSTIEIATVTTRRIIGQATSKLDAGGGNKERTIPSPPRLARPPATGVTKPIRMKAPMVTASKPNTDRPSVRLFKSTR